MPTWPQRDIHYPTATAALEAATVDEGSVEPDRPRLPWLGTDTERARWCGHTQRVDTPVYSGAYPGSKVWRWGSDPEKPVAGRRLASARQEGKSEVSAGHDMNKSRLHRSHHMG